MPRRHDLDLIKSLQKDSAGFFLVRIQSAVWANVMVFRRPALIFTIVVEYGTDIALSTTPCKFHSFDRRRCELPSQARTQLTILTVC